ncbi:MAG TPA: hypothetical protein VND70_07250 [Acidimicrobiales bacterium]|nr:hypothetical protein [Acidimicrobiales bacterium]
MRDRWLSKRAVSLHVATLLLVPGCALGAWWQITRASDGNGLSYLYSVEWPLFAILGLYFWWMLIHTDYESVGLKGMQKTAASVRGTEAGRGGPPAEPGVQPHHPLADEDPELAAYNSRLAELTTKGPKTWRSPERPVVRRTR